MEEIKVSVIIAIYNKERYLRQCLDSVVNQTLQEIEIICVDDGSRDSTPLILAEYEKKYPKLRVLRQENSGAGAARNLGLRNARGEYLSFLDADDFFEPEMLERAYLIAQKEAADIAVFGSDQYWEDQEEFERADWVIHKKDLPPYQPMNRRNFTDNVFKVFVGWAWDKLIRTAFIRENDLTFQEIRTSNDMRFTFLAVVLAKKIVVDTTVYAHQRKGNPNSLSNTREKSWNCFHEALISMRQELIKRNLYWELEQDYINYTLHASLWNLKTITGEKKKVLFDTLKNEWFEEFGVINKPERYFYNKHEYMQYRLIMQCSFQQWEALYSAKEYTKSKLLSKR